MALDLNLDQPAHLSSPGKELKLDLLTSTPCKNGEDSGQPSHLPPGPQGSPNDEETLPSRCMP